ncbi:hypothetical protein AMECASPLE_009814 [Ameca splendens]|uniref:Uncharacterized protein n=1 Tax=Ameca splendens TaxID=208324 RepID=A0ABV0XPB5_9TELE
MASDLEGLILILAACEPDSCSSYTETGWPLVKGQAFHTPGAVPTGHHEGHSQMPSPVPQNTCGPIVQTAMNPQAPCSGFLTISVMSAWVMSKFKPPASAST